MGQHGRRRRRVSDAYVRLLEKAKLRAIYSVSESQLHRYYEQAARSRGRTGDELLRLLECRLDALVRRLGFATTASQARQLVLHGHVRVDGRRVTRPGYRVRPGERIALGPKARLLETVHRSIEGVSRPPPYLRRAESWEGELLRLPEREEIPLPVPVEDRLVVEHYA
jgi:small subunit ribosomal protein S4